MGKNTMEGWTWGRVQALIDSAYQLGRDHGAEAGREAQARSHAAQAVTEAIPPPTARPFVKGDMVAIASLDGHFSGIVVTGVYPDGITVRLPDDRWFVAETPAAVSEHITLITAAEDRP